MNIKKINENEVEVDGKLYIAVESTGDCNQCSFNKNEKCMSGILSHIDCIKSLRIDNRAVKWKLKGEKMKYKIIKKINLKSLLNDDACETAVKYAAENFGKQDVIWTKDLEEYLTDESESNWIDWLIDREYIKENVEEIVFDCNKIYIICDGGEEFKLTGFISPNRYMFSSLNETMQGLCGEFNTSQEVIDEAQRRRLKIWIGNSTEDFYKEKFKIS